MKKSSRREQAKCVRHNHVSKFTKSLLYPPLACLLSSTFLHAAVDDEYVGEQMYSPTGVPESEKSFWDPSFWRDKTAPLESPVIPGESQWLYFGRKSHLGVPYAEPARDLTLYTAARLGFTPPAVTPSFARVYFSGDEIVFNGTPEAPATALGRFVVAAPHPIMLTQGAKIDFDRTIVDTTNLDILGKSSLTLTGDVTSAGETYNLRNTAFTDTSRVGVEPEPLLRLRNGAIADLATFGHSFTPDPIPTTGNAPAVKIETGSHFKTSALLVYQAAGKIIDASNGRGLATIGGITATTGSLTGVDPLIMFHATGDLSPAPASAFSVTNMTVLNSFKGTLAQIEDHATMNFGNTVAISGDGGILGLQAHRHGSIVMNNLDSVSGTSAGSTQLDWQASTNGNIALTQVMGSPLHLNGETHTISALSGGKIDIPTNLGIDPAGRVQLIASDAGSRLSLDGSTQLLPHNAIGNPAAVWDKLTLNVLNGAHLRGGSVVDFGGGNAFVDMRTLYANRTTGLSDVTINNALLENIELSFNEASVNMAIGTLANPAALHQVNLNIADSSFLTIRSGTWQPESLSLLYHTQQLQLGDRTGGSFGVITDGAIVHSVAMRIGNGVFRDPGAPEPVVANTTLTIEDGSTVTGILTVAPLTYGKGSVIIRDAGTNCGYKNVQLGLTSYPMMNNAPGGGPPGFTGLFNTSVGGTASLSVLNGARLSIGCYEDFFALWRQPSSFEPAYLSANHSDVTIDATSAIYLGDAANAAARDFRNGALVVGPSGYLVGWSNIIGAAADGNDLVVAGGTVAPGFSPGTIEVDGNFLMESGTLVLEVKSNTAGGWDVIDADSITITGGTIIIKPTSDYDSGAGFTADFFQTSNLSISPGVTIQINPILAGATFSGSTGEISLIGGTEHDLNTNGIDDRFEAVLPAAGNSLEWPSLGSPSISPPTFTFRRIDGSSFTHNITVQWSNDLLTWYDIAVPGVTEGSVTITSNDNDPDTIVVSLPPPSGANQKIFARLAISKIIFPF